MDKKSVFFGVCRFITKYSILAMAFLVPVFFLPWTADFLDFNKQALMLALGSLALFAWMAEAFFSGKMELPLLSFKNIGISHFAVPAVFLAGILSTIFSIYPYGSFWGWPQVTSESLLLLLLLCCIYFLISASFSKKDILILFWTVFISSVFAQIFGILHLFEIVGFNTIGTPGMLGVFSAFIMPLSFFMMASVKKWQKILFVLQLFLSFVIFLLIGYPVVWLVVASVSAVSLFASIIVKKIIDGRWTAVIVFFLAVSLFFAILNPQIKWLPHNSNEIFLSQKSSLNIAVQAVKADLFFGSGPGTFGYDFSKFKDVSFYGSPLWAMVFTKAGSEFLNDASTLGLLGLLAEIAFLFLPVFFGLKFLLSFGKNESSPHAELVMITALWAMISARVVAYFLFSSGVVLDFVYFISVAGLAGLIARERKTHSLKPSSVLTLVATFCITLTAIFFAGILFLGGQRYFAEIEYYKSSGHGILKLESAVRANPGSDLYFRQLAMAYLSEIQKMLQNSSGQSKQEASDKVQTLISNAVNAGRIAVSINRNNFENWSLLGFVYQNLAGILPDAKALAISSYEEALKLSPENPYVFFQEGSVYFQDKDFAKAQEKLESAVKTNPYYSNALYALGLVYDRQGNKSKAIEQFAKVRQLNPQNEDIAKILENLKAGKPALQTAEIPEEKP